MKKTSIIILALTFLAALTQCKKEQQVAPANEGVAITLDIKGGNGTRMDVNTSTGEVTYKSGDVIYVASGGHYVGTLTHNGTRFSGIISDPTVGEPLDFYFLGNVTPAETLTPGTTTTCSVVISDQTQHLPVIEYAPSNETYTAGATTFTAHLLNKCALVKFNVSTSSEAATCIVGMKNKVTVSFAENTLTHSQEGNGVITFPAGNGEKWAILLPQEAVGAGGIGSAYSIDGEYMGTCGAVPVITENGYQTVGIEVSVNSETGGSGGDHGYVDLGLPSGTLWATCNVGADTPEGYGNYFAWGETQPKYTYDWNTYQYCMGSSSTLTKYCNNSNYGYNGFTDNLTTLLPEDDAATANWGADWRMPTKEEWQELYNNTTCTWTTQNSVNGRLFTASNGNSLFLPAAGYRNYSNLYGAGSYGNYWSSSLDSVYPSDAWGFYFDSDYYGMSYNSRRIYGLSVRAVRSSSQNTVPTGAIDGKFTINASGDQVYFSQGNLQYIGSATTPYWKFADNQWDYLGTTTNQNSTDQDIDRDLFGWGTSGWSGSGATYYCPWDTNNSNGSLYGPPGQYNLTGTYTNADWGVYNPISNGGNQTNQWRTLTKDEWVYVFNTRSTVSGIRYTKAKVNNVNGVVLLPDDWSANYYTLSNTNTYNANFSSNTITASQWSTLEQHGAVFLPAAGSRSGTSLEFVSSHGTYWSASYYYNDAAYRVYFYGTPGESGLGPQVQVGRYLGSSVRLVQEY